MVYLSHSVRRLCEEPIDGESVALLVRAEAPAVEDVASELDELGTVEEYLRFDTIKASVPQTAVQAVCDFEGIDAVETVNTLTLAPDGAGEDVDYDEG